MCLWRCGTLRLNLRFSSLPSGMNKSLSYDSGSSSRCGRMCFTGELSVPKNLD